MYVKNKLLDALENDIIPHTNIYWIMEGSYYAYIKSRCIQLQVVKSDKC